MGSVSADCVFCKIISGQIPSPKLYEDDSFICIKDIRPQAPVHLLVVSKLHIASLDEAFHEKAESPDHTLLMGQLLRAVTAVARRQKLLPRGFRTIINTGPGGGQTVFHIHAHVLGGETLEEQL